MWEICQNWQQKWIPSPWISSKPLPTTLGYVNLKLRKLQMALITTKLIFFNRVCICFLLIQNRGIYWWHLFSHDFYKSATFPKKLSFSSWVRPKLRELQIASASTILIFFFKKNEFGLFFYESRMGNLMEIAIFT